MFDFICIDTMIESLACVIEIICWRIRDKADSMEENIIDIGVTTKKAKEETESEKHLNSKLESIYGEDLYSKEQKEVVDEANKDMADAFLRDIFSKKQKPCSKIEEEDDEDENENELKKASVKLLNERIKTEKEVLELQKQRIEATKEAVKTNKEETKKLKEERIFFKRVTHMITILVTVMCVCMVIKLFIKH